MSYRTEKKYWRDSTRQLSIYTILVDKKKRLQFLFIALDNFNRLVFYTVKIYFNAKYLSNDTSLCFFVGTFEFSWLVIIYDKGNFFFLKQLIQLPSWFLFMLFLCVSSSMIFHFLFNQNIWCLLVSLCVDGTQLILIT